MIRYLTIGIDISNILIEFVCYMHIVILVFLRYVNYL